MKIMDSINFYHQGNHNLMMKKKWILKTEIDKPSSFPHQLQSSCQIIFSIVKWTFVTKECGHMDIRRYTSIDLVSNVKECVYVCDVLLCTLISVRILLNSDVNTARTFFLFFRKSAIILHTYIRLLAIYFNCFNFIEQHFFKYIRPFQMFKKIPKKLFVFDFFKKRMKKNQQNETNRQKRKNGDVQVIVSR